MQSNGNSNTSSRQRNTHSPPDDHSQASESENSDLDSDNDTKGRSVKTSQTPARRRRRVVSEGAQRHTQQQQQQQRPLRRVASQKNQSADDASSRRKTPVKQRKRADPRAQNSAIGGNSNHEEKERPRFMRRAASNSGDLLSSPHRSVRRLTRKDGVHACAAATLDDEGSTKPRRNRPRASSPRRCTSPRRAKSPRKHRGSNGSDEQSKYTKSSSRGRQTPTTDESSTRLDTKSPDTTTPSDEPQFPAASHVRPDHQPQFPEATHVRPGALEQHQHQSPRSLNEAEDGLLEEASRSSKQADNHVLKPYSGHDSSSNFTSEDDDDNNDATDSEGYKMAAVLQFDPTQADNVFMAKQVAKPSSDLHMKNKDGTECVFNISGIEDPLSSVSLAGRESAAGQPMFDFLGDQPDEEQQEHTESAEREAFDESTRLKEMLPADIATAKPKSTRSAAPSPLPHKEKPHPPPKKRVVKGGAGGGRPKPVSRTLSTANVATSGTRPAPAKRGVKGAKSMGPRLASRKGPTPEQKGHKKLVNDTKNYSQFFNNTADQAATGGEADHQQTHPMRPRPRPRQRSRRAVDDNAGYSESEAEAAQRPRRIKKRVAPGTEKKQRKYGRDNNDSFSFSDTERIRKPGGGRSNDAFAMSDTEALHVKRRDAKPAFSAGPFPNGGSFSASFNASFTSSPNKAMTGSARDLFGASNNPLDNSIEASAASLFAPNPEISLSPTPKSPGNPLEASSACLVSDMDAQADVPSTPTKDKDKKKTLKSVGIAVSIGRYFGRKGGKGTASDVGDSDADNNSVVSGGSRLFGGRNRAQQHHLLLDGGSVSSMDASLDFELPSALS